MGLELANSILTRLRNRPFCSDPKGSTVKLTFAISVVALVLIAGTTSICMSGAVNENTTEYGSAHATMEALFNPHAKVCR